MSTVNNIPTGLLVPAQVPLDAKLYVANEASLINLGVANNLAYTYYQGMVVYCVAEKRRYEWREVVGAELGLLPVAFTYPSSLVVNGVDYSGKTFNFFIVLNNIAISNVGTGATWYKGFNILGNTFEFKTFTSTGLLITATANEVNIENKSGTNVGTGAYGYKGINPSTKLHEFRTFRSMNPAISITQVGDEIRFNSSFYNTIIQAGTGITVTGTGTALDPYIISSNPVASPWLTGDVKEVVCTPAYMAANFVATGVNAGLGINERAGWAIMNGKNGTPNDKGKVVVAYGIEGGGTNYPVLNATGGAETHQLTINQMPTHGHPFITASGNGNTDPGGGIAMDGNGTQDVQSPYSGQVLFGPNNLIGGSGGNEAHNNMQPYVVRLKIMKL